MKKIILVISFCLLVVGIPFAIVTFPPIYTIAFVVGVVLLSLIFLGILIRSGLWQ